MLIEKLFFDLPNGDKITEIIVQNKNGLRMSFCTLGARVNQCAVQNNQGEWEQLILGFENPIDELKYHTYYGATVGRVAGRIDRGKAMIQGTEYQFPINNGPNHLHGGLNTLDVLNWQYRIEEEEEEITIIFDYVDAAGNNGYPGELHVRVSHTLTNQNEWIVKTDAVSDEWTLWNPTNHVYFNLNGNNSAPVTNHHLQIDAPYYLPLREDSIPTGEVASVEGTVFDLREGALLGERLSSGAYQLEIMRGYDHPFVLDVVHGPSSAVLAANGRKVSMVTSEPCVVVYTHNWVPDPLTIWGNPIVQYAGVTMETQAAPDAINQPNLGDVLLPPRTVDERITRFIFEW